jgi:methylase of polypeptide subunit release factors
LLVPILAAGPDRVLACELDATLAGELFAQFPQVALSQGDFLEKNLGEFDRIAMNPPFHMRADIAHILHAAGHLAPSGVLVGLCLATRDREDALRPLCDHWETIQAGAFRAEGTNVETVLFRIRN